MRPTKTHFTRRRSTDSLGGVHSPRGSLGAREPKVSSDPTLTQKDQDTRDVSANGNIDQALTSDSPSADVRTRSDSPNRETQTKASVTQDKAPPKVDVRSRGSSPPKSDTRNPPKSGVPPRSDTPPKRSPLGMEWRNTGFNTQADPAPQAKVNMQSSPKAEEPTPTTSPKYGLRTSPGVSPSFEWRSLISQQQQAGAQSSPKIDVRSLSSNSPKLLSRSSSAQGVSPFTENKFFSRSPSAPGGGLGTESRKIQPDVPEEPLPPMTALQESMKFLCGEVSQMSRNMQDFEESIHTGPMFRSIRSTIRSELEQFFKELVVEAVVPEIGKAVLNCSPPQSPVSLSRGCLAETQQNTTSSGQPTKQGFKADSLAMGRRGASGSKQATLEEPLLGMERSPRLTSRSNSPSNQRRTVSGSSLRAESRPDSVNSLGNLDSVNRRTSIGSHFRDHQIMRHDAIAERNEIKTRLEEALAEDEFNAEDYYNDTGIWQQWARQDSWFSSVSLMVILANVIWLGIDEDLNQADVLCDAPLLSQVMNNIFCVFFLFELIVKFLAFQNKKVAFTDGMFIFDLLLVVFMVWETWIEVFLYLNFNFHGGGGSKQTQLFRFLRLFRLSRIPRIVRLSASLPELMVLMKGMIAAMRSVFAILLFIGIVIFVFSILFTELLRSKQAFKDDFANVPRSMQTLLLHVLCGVDPDFINQLLEEGWIYYLLYLLFLFLGTLTLMNMMVGVLCDVVSSVSEEEKDRVALQTLEYQIGDIAAMIDTDGSGTISKTEFEQLLQHKQVLKSLHGIDVDVMSFGGLTKYIYRDEDSELTFAEFCQLVAHFRGSRYATVKDLVETQKFITMEVNGVVFAIEDLLTELLH